MATKKANYESTKVIDELFVYGYKLRKLGLDDGLVHDLMNSFIVGSPGIMFAIPEEKLSEDQEKVVKILTDNGFTVKQNGKSLFVKNNHFGELKKELDEFFKSKE